MAKTVYDFTKENLKEYYIKNNITNYKKNSNGDPDMRYGENKRNMVSMIKSKLLEKNYHENIKNYNDESYYDYQTEIINISDREIKDFF
tara:strand:- start:7491 stop:7757 length:267 start_codon:yes stop_codon:yes gene_type:complete